MSEENETTDLEGVNGYIECFEGFVKVVESFANQAHIHEAYELEAPCRAAAYHVNTLLDYVRSAREGMQEEVPAEKAESRLARSHLSIVRKE